MTIVEIFWSNLVTYNNAIFPFQIITLIVAVVLTVFLFAKPGGTINKLMKAYLAFTYAWIGVVFQFIFAPPEFRIGFLISGIVLIMIALLFVIDIFAEKIEFKLPKTRGKKYLTLFWVVFAFSLYPLIEWFLGHPYPGVPLFGVLFCPTTIFSIALLAGAIPKVDKKVFVLLAVAAILTGISAPVSYHIYVDIMLLAAGVYGLVTLIKNWRVIGKGRSLEE